MSSMKILGIDYGSKRVGLAISDETGDFAFPLAVIENIKNDALDGVKKAAEENKVKEIVLGESQNYNVEANPIMAQILEFKEKLIQLGYSVHLEPEFMTSMQARRLQGPHDKIDASAAALILQSFLDKRKNADTI